MSMKIARAELSAIATTRDEPLSRAVEVDRTFELPGVLFGLTFACYFGFLAVMAVGLATPRLAIPLGICAFLLIMAFGVPQRWAKMKPHSSARSLTWSRFMQSGIRTGSGPLTGPEAMAQVLLLPGLILFWGIYAVAVFALS